MRAQYLTWVHKYVIDETEKLRPLYSPKAFREIRNDLAHEIASGQYGFGTVKYQAVAETEAGVMQFFRVVLKEPNAEEDELRELLLAKGEEINAAIDRVNGVTRSKTTEEADPDPKPTTPPNSM
jgi:hypothetical protein